MNRQRVDPLISGAITIVVVLVLMITVVISGLPSGPAIPGLSSRGVAYKALLSDTDGLQPRASVQIAGVKVGEVRSLELQGQLALVTLDIQPQYADIHTDAAVL